MTAVGCGPSPAEIEKARYGDKYEALNAVKQFVEMVLKYPEEAEFRWVGDPAERRQSASGASIWPVKGTVKARGGNKWTDSHGVYVASITHEYSAQLEYVGGGKYRCRMLTFNNHEIIIDVDLLADPQRAATAREGDTGPTSPVHDAFRLKPAEGQTGKNTP